MNRRQRRQQLQWCRVCVQQGGDKPPRPAQHIAPDFTPGEGLCGPHAQALEDEQRARRERLAQRRIDEQTGSAADEVQLVEVATDMAMTMNGENFANLDDDGRRFWIHSAGTSLMIAVTPPGKKRTQARRELDDRIRKRQKVKR